MVTEKEKQIILEFRDKGLKYQEISEKTQINFWKVKKIVRELKYPKNIQGKWNKEEELYLIENYSEKGPSFCSKFLKRAIDSVQRKAVSLNLKINKKQNWCKHCNSIVSEQEIVVRKRRNKIYKRQMCKKCSYNQRKSSRKRLRKYFTVEGWTTRTLGSIRSRAKKKGLDFNLDRNWFKENLQKKCPIFKKEYIFPNGEDIGHAGDFSASIDRIDNNKGYTKDNCIIICKKVNAMKCNGTLNELIKLTDFYKNLINSRIEEDYLI